MDYKRYAFPIPNLELETLHTYARLVKERFPEIDTSYVEGLTERDLEIGIQYLCSDMGNFLVVSERSYLCWGWNPSKFFDCVYEVISLDGNGNSEFLGYI